jgi:Tfp pilus assembly protein FimT
MNELFQGAMLSIQMAILAVMFISLAALKRCIKECRNVAEHARATANMNEVMARGIATAYQPVQLKQDDQGREIVNLKGRVELLEARA